MYPTYYNHWYVQHAGYCPVLRYTIEDNSGNAWTDSAKFSLVNSGSLTSARLDIQLQNTFETYVRIHGYQMVKDAFMTLKIRVCGQEEIRLHDATKKYFLMGKARGTPSSLSDSVRYYSVA
jgi:hypothetical protein